MKQIEVRVEIAPTYVSLEVNDETDTLDEVMAFHKEEIDAKVRDYLENQAHFWKGFRYVLVEPSQTF